MAYNIYIIIAIVVGYALGYFLFGQTAIKIKLKNCQVKRDTFCMADCGDPGKIIKLIIYMIKCYSDKNIFFQW